MDRKKGDKVREMGGKEGGYLIRKETKGEGEMKEMKEKGWLVKREIRREREREMKRRKRGEEEGREERKEAWTGREGAFTVNLLF